MNDSVPAPRSSAITPDAAAAADSEQPTSSGTPTALYRLFDAEERLLYVGITKELNARFAAHRDLKPWWSTVTRRAIEWFDARELAARAEVEAIRTEMPLYNMSRSLAPMLVSESGARWISADDLNRYEWISTTQTAKRVADSGIDPSMTRQKLMYRATKDPKWPVSRDQWRLVSGSWLFPWELVLAFFQGDSPASLIAARSEEDQTPLVTFTSGASLLVKLGIVARMGREGVRFIAKTDPDWPFGDGRPYAYQTVGQTLAMAREPFLEFFRARQRRPRIRKPAFNASNQPRRGHATLRLARSHFGTLPFATADLQAVSDLCAASVAQHVQILRKDGLLAVAGTRPNNGKAGKPHTLYVVTEPAGVTA